MILLYSKASLFASCIVVEYFGCYKMFRVLCWWIKLHLFASNSGLHWSIFGVIMLNTWFNFHSTYKQSDWKGFLKFYGVEGLTETQLVGASDVLIINNTGIQKIFTECFVPRSYTRISNLCLQHQHIIFSWHVEWLTV